MEQKEIFALMTKFEASSLSVMKIEQDDFKIHLEKPGPQAAAVIPMSAPQQVVSPLQQPMEAMENTYEKVKSPIVGVFYNAPSPNDPPFVEVGQTVKAGQVLCLVEAMKMMNELKTPVDGVIKATHGETGQLVEFDQILFEVESC